MGAGTTRLSPGAGVTQRPQAGWTSVSGHVPLQCSPWLPRLPCWGFEDEWEVDSSLTSKHPISSWPGLPSYLEARAAQGHRPRRQTSHSQSWSLNCLGDPLRGWGRGGGGPSPKPKKPGQQGDLKKGTGHREGGQRIPHCTLPQTTNNALFKRRYRQPPPQKDKPGIT